MIPKARRQIKEMELPINFYEYRRPRLVHEPLSAIRNANPDFRMSTSARPRADDHFNLASNRVEQLIGNSNVPQSGHHS